MIEWFDSLIGGLVMRSKFATVAAVFIPLGFIGGLTQGSIGIAMGSAIFWTVVFLVIRPKY